MTAHGEYGAGGAEQKAGAALLNTGLDLLEAVGSLSRPTSRDFVIVCGDCTGCTQKTRIRI